MKVIYIFLISLIPSVCLSQTPPFSAELERILKYWYYRDRMNTEFMLGQGLGDGLSLPANERLTNTIPVGQVKFGDVTISLAYYIATLAMEYKMLNDAGHDASATLDELYYAIEAINRLDRNAELDWGGGQNLNGFFIRDDVGRNFNNNGAPDVQSPIYQAILSHLNSGSNPVVATGMDSDWFDFFRRPPYSVNKKKYWHAESFDQIIHIVVAVMTVKQCMPNVTYPLNFSHGTNSFSDEVTSIYKEMINYVHSPGQPTGVIHWNIKDPNGNKVPRGVNMWALAYGFSKAYKTITGERNPKTIFTLTPSWIAAKATFLAVASTPFVYTTSEGLKYLNLIAASNCCGANENNIYNKSYPNSVFDAYHIPPLYQIYHGPPDQQSQSWYETLLDKAPCYGPYNFGNGDRPDWQWSSNSLIIHPERRGLSILGQGELIFPGSYNGLDYMLIYNAYYLAKVGGGFNNYLNRKVITDYPYTYNNGSGNVTTGNDPNPEHILAIKNITASNTIHADGNATYRSGKEINLTTDFEVEPDGYFYGYIDPLHCESNEVNYYREVNQGIILTESSTNKQNENIPANFQISAFPVPFLNTFNVKIALPESKSLVINIFDLQGRVVETIYRGYVTEGEHFFSYDLEHLQFGSYICRIDAGAYSKTFKIIKSK
jgi:hypothetical protein